MADVPTFKYGTVKPARGLIHTLSSAFDRQINKAKSAFWTKTAGVLDTVDNSIAKPALQFRNEAVGAVTSVINPVTVKIALAVIALGIIGYFLMQVNRFRK